jgi:hypothetical protein
MLFCIWVGEFYQIGINTLNSETELDSISSNVEDCGACAYECCRFLDC